MKFDTKRFALAAASAWAVWYTVCALFVAAAPQQTQAVIGFAFHYDLTGVRNLTWASFFGGLILTTAWISAVAATVGAFFNGRTRSRPAELFAGRMGEVPR